MEGVDERYGELRQSMSVVEASEVIDAPPEQVWAVVSDPRNLPRWNRLIHRVEGVPSDGLQEGTEYLTELRFMGLSTIIDAEVLALDPPRYAEIRLSGRPLDAVVRTRLRPLEDGRTLLHHEVEYRLHGGRIGSMLGNALRGLGAQAVLRRGTQAQKVQVERG